MIRSVGYGLSGRRPKVLVLLLVLLVAGWVGLWIQAMSARRSIARQTVVPAMAPPAANAVRAPQVPAHRFVFEIAPNTPVKELLPAPPQIASTARPRVVNDLAQVPEVQFEAPMAKELPVEEAAKQIAHTIAKINHLNQEHPDGFIQALNRERSDLGLSFAMGDECRSKGERNRQFAREVALIRSVLRQGAEAVGAAPTTITVPVPGPIGAAVTLNQVGTASVAVPAGSATGFPDNFWEMYRAAASQADAELATADRARADSAASARVAALTQILASEAPSIRLGLARYLAAIPHVDATRALARLAIFSAEDEIRLAAIDALKLRRERDYTEVLREGLHYPLPEVARRTAEAVVKLERSDLLSDLVDVLDGPDPRSPIFTKVRDQKVPVIREVVRLNHHRSCLLCHAPATAGVAPETVTAAVPLPGQPLPSPGEDYDASDPDLLVRIDVTYLRPDFSMKQAVVDANPWPETQRFDYLVRTRAVTENEADSIRQQLSSREKGRLSPYQRVALAALRELTGLEAEPTPEAWRRLLKLAPKQRQLAMAR